jgi:hypothetical protein
MCSKIRNLVIVFLSRRINLKKQGVLKMLSSIYNFLKGLFKEDKKVLQKKQLEELKNLLLKKLIENQYLVNNQEQEKQIPTELSEQEYEFNLMINNIVNNFSECFQSPEKRKNTSLLDFKDELINYLAIQKFVEKVHDIPLEIDNMADSGTIKLQVFSSKKLKGITKGIVNLKFSVSNVSKNFGRGFSGETEPGYEWDEYDDDEFE